MALSSNSAKRLTFLALVLARPSWRISEDLRFAERCHRRWIGPSGKQGWCDLIDLFVGALGAEQHSDQQRECIVVIQRWCFGVLLVQPADDRFHAFLLLHGCGQGRQSGGILANTVASKTGVIVIGSGIGGLCCAGLLARGGGRWWCWKPTASPAVRPWFGKTYHYESGPSLSGLPLAQQQPLAQILRALGQELEVIEYRNWDVLFPEGHLRIGVGNADFEAVCSSCAVLRRWRSGNASCRCCSPSQPQPMPCRC